jgi:two-component system, cell cycle sensor histidine kinase and response regulator CckA
MNDDRRLTAPHRASRAAALFGKRLPAAVLVISLTATVGMWRMLDTGLRQKGENIFAGKVSDIAYNLDQRLHEHEQLLKGGVGLFNAAGEVSRDVWRRYVASLQLGEKHPGILGVGYSVWLKPEDKEANIRKIRAEGFPEYVIKPPGERPVYTSVIYLEPFTWRNERAFGFDMYSEANRRSAMDKAVSEGVTTIASRILLVQENEQDKQIGILMYLPVYQRDRPTDSPERRRGAMKGFVYSPIRMKDFVYGTLGKLPKDVAFEIFDGENTNPERLMFSSLSSEKVSIPGNYRPTLTKSVRVVEYGRTWTFSFRSLPSFDREFNRIGSLAALAGGILVSCLLTYIAVTLLATRDRALELARAMTKGLRESEGKTLLILNAVGEAIYGIDMDGCCTFCNPACLRMIGYHSQEEVLGKNMHDLIHHSHGDGSPFPAETCRIFKAFHENSDCRVDDEFFWRRDGTSFPVEYWSIPQIDEERVVGAVVTFIDISERKRTEATLLEQALHLQEEVAQRREALGRLREQQLQLETLNLELEARVAEEVKKNRDKDQTLMQNEKMASIGQLAAGVAHEINNPMGFISSNLRTLDEYFHQIIRFDRLLLEEGFPHLPQQTREAMAGSRETLEIAQIMEDGADLIKESLDGAQRVSKIVKDLKSFSRVDAPEQESVLLSSCLESALTICYNELKYVATIRREYEPGPGVLCHPGQLNQVFLNLLVNAGQAMVEPGEIILRCWHDDLFVHASVSDSGNGIPEEVRARIFDPFFTTKEVGKGTGLGLSISQEIIKRHGGEIQVETAPGSGTTFTVTLPRTPERIV